MYIEIDGINVNYKTVGEGENLIILHGWGSNINTFNKVIDEVSKTRRVYALDLPGFGFSEEMKEAFSVSDYANFVIKFMEKLNIKNATVMGHSLGGRIAIYLTKLTQIKKLILVNSAGIKLNSTKKATFTQTAFKVSKAILPEKVVNKLKNKIGSEDYKNASPMMKKTLVKVVNEDLKHIIDKIDVNTLILWGDKDLATPVADAKYMNENIKKSKLIVYEGAGHYSYIDKADEFIKDVISFLGGNN